MNVSARSQPGWATAYREICEQNLDEASFLWLLRSLAVDQPHYTAHDLAELERRVDAHLDALAIVPEEGWAVCREGLELEAGGEAFTAAVVAFRSLEVEKIQQAVEAGFANADCFRGLTSALGWLPAKFCHPWVRKFLTSKDLDHKYLAVAACSVRREDPGSHLLAMLQREDCREHAMLHARCLRLIGELKRHDLVPALNSAMSADNEEVVFWANWSAALLGNPAAVSALKSYVLEPNQWQTEAIQLAFRALPLAEARTCISTMAKDKSQIRDVIKATAALGDPHAINWLISTMREAQVAQLAAEAFTTITGIDLEQNGLAIDVPDLSASMPNENPEDDDVALDEDEHLPWPAVDRIAATWRKYGSSFSPGQRYLMGKPVSAPAVGGIVADGAQRQRHAAALELALLERSQPLVNTRGKIQAVE